LISPSGNKSLNVILVRDADAVVVAIIFNRASMEKSISPCPLAVTGEE
jgi:hypothetical protein